MKAWVKVVAPLAPFSMLFVSTLALACPGAQSAGDGCSSGLGGYMAALGMGLLAGIGSVSLEGFFRRGSQGRE